MKRRILALIGLGICLLLWPSFLTHLFFWRIERRLNLEINRKPVFTVIPGLIRLNGDFLEWKDRLRVRSGSLEIRFPVSALFRKQYPITLEGNNLRVEIAPGLREALGGSEFLFDRFSARLKIRSEPGVDVDFLDAESKTIRFHLNGMSKRGNELTVPSG